MYCCGNTLDDRDYYGREQLLQELYSGPHRMILLLGMRRTGKTSTLLHLERRALRHGDYIPLRIAPEGSKTPDTLRDQFANAINLRAKLLPGLPGDYFRLCMMDLDTLLEVARQCADRAGRPLMLLIDELDTIARLVQRHPAVVPMLRRAFPRDGLSRVVATGSRAVARLSYESTDATEPLLAEFSQRTLAPVLEPDAARELIALSKRNGQGAVVFTPEQTQLAVERTGGHPFILQHLCDMAKRFQSGPEHALNLIRAQQRVLAMSFMEDLGRVSPSERQILQAAVEGRARVDWQDPYFCSLAEMGLLTNTATLSVPILHDFLDRFSLNDIPCTMTDAEVAPGLVEHVTAPSANPPPRGGATFKSIEVLGSGAFGEVLLMERISATGVRRRVAVKFLKKSVQQQSEFAQRLRDEARLLALLRHRAILRAEDIIELNGRLGIVMEYIPGADLRRVMQCRDVEGAGRMPPRVAAAVVAEVADALDAAYNRVPEGENAPIRVLHRDIKPENVRLTPDGEIKIMDFGVAGGRFRDREFDSHDTFGGTLEYMAPERHRGLHDHPGSDIFSLGIVLVESITGINPSSPWPVQGYALAALRQPLLDSLAARTSEALVNLAEQMMDLDPDKRPTAAQVATQLHQMDTSLTGPDLRTWCKEVVGRVQHATLPQPAARLRSEGDLNVLTLPDEYVAPLDQE